MKFLKKLFPKKKDELESIKILLSKSAGARDFTNKLLTTSGFKVLSEDFMGITVKGKNGKFIFSVLESHGIDKIFDLVYKERNGRTIALISEGRFQFDKYSVLRKAASEALDEIGDDKAQDTFAGIAMNNSDIILQLKAVERLTDQKALADVAMKSSN